MLLSFCFDILFNCEWLLTADCFDGALVFDRLGDFDLLIDFGLSANLYKCSECDRGVDRDELFDDEREIDLDRSLDFGGAFDSELSLAFDWLLEAECLLNFDRFFS